MDKPHFKAKAVVAVGQMDVEFIDPAPEKLFVGELEDFGGGGSVGGQEHKAEGAAARMVEAFEMAVFGIAAGFVDVVPGIGSAAVVLEAFGFEDVDKFLVEYGCGARFGLVGQRNLVRGVKMHFKDVHGGNSLFYGPQGGKGLLWGARAVVFIIRADDFFRRLAGQCFQKLFARIG